MKLPKVAMSQVQSLGRSDFQGLGIAGAQAAQTGKTQQNAMDMIAQVAGDYIYRKQTVEQNDVYAATQVGIKDFEAKHGAKKFYTSQELGNIPEDVVPRMETYTDSDGTQVSEFRDNIPADEGYP
ncbi:unnamed protein product, partial [marine sediment metagenome]